MKRFLIAVLGTAVMFATAANAATLVATASPDPVAQGGTVQITLVGTTDPLTETAQSVDVRIVGAGTHISVDTALTGTCTPGFGCLQGAGWTQGGTQSTTTGAGDFQAFSQIGGTSAVPNTNGMGAGPTPPFLTGNSTMTAVFTMTAPSTPGVVQIMLSSVGVGFFGISGSQSLGSYTVVPDPTTAALMGLGLLALAASGRKR